MPSSLAHLWPIRHSLPYSIFFLLYGIFVPCHLVSFVMPICFYPLRRHFFDQSILNSFQVIYNYSECTSKTSLKHGCCGLKSHRCDDCMFVCESVGYGRQMVVLFHQSACHWPACLTPATVDVFVFALTSRLSALPKLCVCSDDRRTASAVLLSTLNSPERVIK